MSTKSSDNGSWSYKAGEKGRNRVRVFEWPGLGIWIDYKDAGERKREPLGHSDRAKAKQLADEVAAQLGAIDQAIEASPVVRRRDGVVTALAWGTLFEMYDEVIARKSASRQANERYAVGLLTTCWGADKLVSQSDRRDWDRFIHKRRTGALNGRPARDGTINLDIRFVRAVINWALTVRENGQPLIPFDPFKGFPVPKEQNERQPSCTEAEYQALRRAAPKVDPRVPLFLELAHETGHRGASAIAKLRWPDIDLDRQGISWRGANDKANNEHWAPISKACARALKRARKAARVIGDVPVFPDSTDPSTHVSGDVVKHWWAKLERLSGIERILGRGWHSLRRKFATEHDSLKVTMDLGGWKKKDTVLKYQKPSESNLRDALERRSDTRRRANGQ